MILVLTSESGDASHPKIIDWLEYYNANYIVLNGESLINENTKFTIKNNQIFYSGINLTKQVKVVFYRRWIYELDNNREDDNYLREALGRNLISEVIEIRNYLFTNLTNAVWFPDIKSVNVNKLSILENAKKCNLKVPDFIVTNNKTDLVKFFNKQNKQLITKAIGNFKKNVLDNKQLVNPIHTKFIDEEIVNKLPDYFAISLFQQLIHKNFEYRILYFNEKCYSTAILSQESQVTKHDSRINNADYESRLVAIDIDKKLEEKIINFMKFSGLNTGSLDFISSKEGEIYFLEVNPVGQISGYSERCNLNFEKELVENLIIIDND